MTQHRISKIGLKRLKEEFPEGFDPEHSYGIMPKQNRPEDTVYWLDYDHQKRQLKLNGFVVRQFQLEGTNDVHFKRLFSKKGWEKRIVVDGSTRAGVLIDNTELPKKLRNAMFDKGKNDTLLVAYTVIRRERAKNFNVNDKEVQDFINKKRDQHYSLLEAGKRK